MNLCQISVCAALLLKFTAEMILKVPFDIGEKGCTRQTNRFTQSYQDLSYPYGYIESFISTNK